MKDHIISFVANTSAAILSFMTLNQITPIIMSFIAVVVNIMAALYASYRLSTKK